MKEMPWPLNTDSKYRLLLDSSTNLDLLAALKSASNEPWSLFLKKYKRLLHRWCEEWNASAEDAEDVVQDTLLELFQKLNDYKVNPEATFRSWLRKVAYFRYLRIVRKKRRSSPHLDASAGLAFPGLIKVESPEICNSFMELIDIIANQEIIEIACLRIANRVETRHWSVFCRRELEGQPSKIVAEEFKITTNSVDVITFRIRKMIRAELQMLDPAP